MKRSLSLFLALIMLFALCACNDPEPAPTEPAASPTPTPYTPTAYRSHGQRIVLNTMPEKVLVAGPNCAEIFCALGLEDLVVGKCMTNHSKGILPEYKDAYKKIPTLCVGYPTLEQIVESGCDFLYASDWMFSDSLTVEDVEAKGIHVFVNDATSYDELWEQIRDLSRVFALPSAGTELVEAQEQRIDAVAAVVKDVEKPKKVLVVDSFVGDKVFTVGGNNIVNEYLRSAGCVNVFEKLEKSWDAVPVEDIVAANPDFIIFHNYKDSSASGKIEQLKANPELQYLDCIRNERFLKLSLENAMPGMRSARTVETIAYTIYCELFTLAAETQAPQ